MNINFTRDEALALLKKYNKEKFHIEHALTLEGVMGWYARELGYGEEDVDVCKEFVGKLNVIGTIFGSSQLRLIYFILNSN